MLWHHGTGGLELRREADGSARLVGRFPYGAETVLVPAGRMGRARKEVIAPRAFAPRLREPGADIYLLAGHDFDKPLASRSAGTLTLRDSAAALELEARITPAVAATSHGRDALALAEEGLAVGLSPGFRLVDDPAAERIGETGDGAILRTIVAAELHELSIVTRPAYPAAQVEARCWTTAASATAAARRRMLL